MSTPLDSISQNLELCKAKVKKIYDMSLSLDEYQALLKSISRLEMATFLQHVHGNNPSITSFHVNPKIAQQKMAVFFQHVKRLGLDLNYQVDFTKIEFNVPKHVQWVNGPLHTYISNERFELVEAFLALSKIHEIAIDLNLQDNEGKTALFFAIKLGNAPIASIRAILTQENYNTPDFDGTTPIMIACALRRIDIVQLLLQEEAHRLKLGNLNFSELSSKQKAGLAPYVNQRHPSSKKSLAHFASLRSGVDAELDKPNTYQQTVLNILKSSGIDGRREHTAQRNAMRTSMGKSIHLDAHGIKFFSPLLDLKKEVLFTQLAFAQVKHLENAILCSKRNSPVIQLMATHSSIDKKALYQELAQEIASYSGISCVTDILSRTKESLELLYSLGIDFSVRQVQGNKTVLEYIEPLQFPENNPNVSLEDKLYIGSQIRAVTAYSKAPLASPVSADATQVLVQSSPLLALSLDPNFIIRKVLRLQNIILTAQEYQTHIESITAHEIIICTTKHTHFDVFCTLFHFDPTIAKLKMQILFQHVRRLNINLNAKTDFMKPELNSPKHQQWINTQLHTYLGNECFYLVEHFMALAKQHELPLDSTLQDNEGKTALFFAIKLGNAPLSTIKALLTAENYNIPDFDGTTPLMMSCAMRRVDIMELILQQAASALNLGQLNFAQLNAQQKTGLDPLIQQQHPVSKKSLAHFAVLRAGCDTELAKPNTYQQTVLNILKSVGIDGRREHSVLSNTLTAEGHTFVLDSKELNFLLSQEFKINTDIIFTPLAFAGVENVSNALLASLKNQALLEYIAARRCAEATAVLIEFKQYSGISAVSLILSRTAVTLQFLYRLGIDLSLKQVQGNTTKTVLEYIEPLQFPEKNVSVTIDDKLYIASQMAELKKHSLGQQTKELKVYASPH